MGEGTTSGGAEICRLPEVPMMPGYAVDGCALMGDATSRAAHPVGSELWAVEATLEAGAELTWPAEHGEQVLYVVDGDLEADGWDLPARSALVVEAAAMPRVRVRGASRVVHFGSASTNAGGGSCHPVGPDGRAARELVVDGKEIRSQFFADSTCATCSPTLLRVEMTEGYRLRSHSHSADELIFMLRGDLRLGREELGPGDVLRVAADHRYGLVSRNGFEFLNFRAELSSITTDPAGPPQLETAAAHGYVEVEPHLQPA